MTEYKGLFRMRWFWLIMGLLCLPMGISATDTRTIYIHPIETDPNSRVFAALIDTAQAQLDTYALELVIVDDVDGLPQWIDVAVFDGALQPYVYITARGARDHALSASHLLSPHRVMWHCCEGQVPYLNYMERFKLTAGNIAPIAHLIHALALYTAQHYAEAHEAFSEAERDLMVYYQIFPVGFRHFINFYQANSQLMLGNYDAAIRSLEAATMNNFGVYQHYSPNLVWLYLQTGQTDQALELLAVSTSVFNPASIGQPLANPQAVIADLLPRRAQLYALAFEYDAAIEDLNTAIALVDEYPEFASALPDLHTLRGEMVLLLYEWRQAIADFDTALRYDPEYAPAYFQRGVAHYTDLNPEAALKDFERYLQLAPNGDDAQQAAHYRDLIQAELEALDGN